jgi:hypothetical protein
MPRNRVFDDRDTCSSGQVAVISMISAFNTGGPVRVATALLALILVTYNGIGQTTDAGASLRIAPLFETGDSRYVWLTRLQAVGVGERVGTTVKYDIYALK